jgi:hypothetical protein
VEKAHVYLRCSAATRWYVRNRQLCMLLSHLSCVAGQYLAATGASTCSDCAAGKFSDTGGATSVDTCLHCAAGKFSAATGASTCQDCLVVGKYSAATATTCQDCLAGKYSAATGASIYFKLEDTERA